MSLTFISAGAGSGKTHTLMQTLGRQLADGAVRPSGVIATTFTKKAATELRERVRQHLIGVGRLDLANAMGQARIGTVNSVCGDLLQRFAFEAGMAPKQQVLDEGQAAQLVREAVEAAMNTEQVREISALADRLGIEDWVGSIGDLLAQARGNDIDPDDLSQFAEQNADELLAHFPAPLRDSLTQDLSTALRRTLPELRTAAKTSNKQNTSGYLERLEQFSRALDGGTWRWSDWIQVSKAAPEKALLPLAEPIQLLARACDAHPALHQDIRAYLTAIFAVCGAALEHYRQHKLVLGVVDFTDQEHLLLKLLDNTEVVDVLRDELDLLMVDEFQDTSPIQLALFVRLSRLSRHTCWVGDIKQAIYGFRGSDTALMQAVIAGLAAMGGDKQILGGSWRSRPALVHLVNEAFVPAFASSLPANEVALRPQRTESTGNPALMRWNLAGSNVAVRSIALATGVRRLLGSGYQVPDKSTGALRPLVAADVAVLCRSHDAVKRTAGALRRLGIAAATAQPGLLATPEAALALACLRRLSDPDDTLASAEILSLADGQEAEAWLADRLRFIASGSRDAAWRETGDAAHPVLARLAELRTELPLLTPYEALRRVMAGCDLPRTVLRWRQDPLVARTRLANLDALLGMATQYEDACRSTGQAASVSGLLLWLRAQQAAAEDALAEPGVDAVRVLTHHAAKGLEWPVVILNDLEKANRDRLWGITTVSRSGFDAGDPLKDRFIRYWPWPFGRQAAGIAVKDRIDQSAEAAAFRDAAVAEALRLLYVSMTRSREMLVLALNDKANTQAWFDCLDARWMLLGDDKATTLTTPSGHTVPVATWQLDATQAGETPAPVTTPLFWSEATPSATHLPLFLNPSSSGPSSAHLGETVRIGERIAVAAGTDWSQLGSAIHACLAASFTNPGTWLSSERVAEVLDRFQVGACINANTVCRQIDAFHGWVAERWPTGRPLAEVPVRATMPNGQVLYGRIDLLLETETGYVLIDHKSSPLGGDQWEDLAAHHQAQLAAYASAIEKAGPKRVLERWIWLPVAGGALRVNDVQPA